jgi:hypothetical protein
MSFPTKKAKENHDNSYLRYLQLQIQNANKITEHNKNSDLSFQDGIPTYEAAEPEDVRALDDQIADNEKQKQQAYKNA